jgi:GntR family transcriptional regulator, transcriptional repressor for pyruvate dehydrogenase complex
MSFREMRKLTVPEEIVQDILEMIQKGELQPGDQMPTERELMERMNVSRSSLREALSALSIMNIIKIHPGRRSIITSLEPDLLVKHLEFAISLEDTTLFHLFEVRKMLEVNCAGMAAERIEDEEIQKLVQLLEEDTLRDADIDIHREIVEITKNPIIKRIYKSIEQLSQMSRERTGNISGVREQAKKDHPEIIQTIISRDPKAAQEAMLKHLAFIEIKLREDISSSDRDKTENI